MQIRVRPVIGQVQHLGLRHLDRGEGRGGMDGGGRDTAHGSEAKSSRRSNVNTDHAMAEYLNGKSHLFSNLLPEKGLAAIPNIGLPQCTLAIGLPQCPVVGTLTSMPSGGHTRFIISLKSKALELSLLVERTSQFRRGTYSTGRSAKVSNCMPPFSFQCRQAATNCLWNGTCPQ